MKKTVLLHPFFFAIFPSISLIADHLGFIEFNRTLFFAGSGTLLFTAIFLKIANIFSPNRHKSGLIATCLILWFFSYGHVFDFLNDTIVAVSHRVLFAAWVILLWGGLFFLVRKKADYGESLTQFLNIVSALLLLVSVFQIARYELYRAEMMWKPEPLINSDQFASMTTPDIYYIVLDGYASADTLQEVYKFDNSRFLEGLENRGFYIAEASRSNYAITTLSLASSLNLTHVNLLRERFGPNNQDTQLTKEMILDNRASRFLKEQGYEYIFLGSGFGVTQNNPFADIDIQCGRIDETVGRLIGTTILRAFADKGQFIREDERRWRLCMFDTLANMPRTRIGPKFVFAHIPVPHWPYLFDAAGNRAALKQPLSREEEMAGYLNQLTYLNGRVAQITDAIITNSDHEPIIIIQADHGPAIGTKPAATQRDSTPAHYRERMNILNAYYLPQSGGSQLYDSITPVNSLRLIFNTYFGADLPLEADRSYYSFYEYPYQFIDVTKSIEFETNK